LIHQYHGWSFWDYAAGAPYMKIDMNASETAYKDAVFISTHKFVGGPETTGKSSVGRKLNEILFFRYFTCEEKIIY
jgi:selenocysteine lyase/cysteine desulfurase